MATQLRYDMAVPAAVQAGGALDIRSIRGRLVQLSGTFVATVQFQVSLDGTAWENLSTALTAPGFKVIEEGWNFIRANVTAYTSGTPVGKVGGFV